MLLCKQGLNLDPNSDCENACSSSGKSLVTGVEKHLLIQQLKKTVSLECCEAVKFAQNKQQDKKNGKNAQKNLNIYQRASIKSDCHNGKGEGWIIHKSEFISNKRVKYQ